MEKHIQNGKAYTEQDERLRLYEFETAEERDELIKNLNGTEYGYVGLKKQGHRLFVVGKKVVE